MTPIEKARAQLAAFAPLPGQSTQAAKLRKSMLALALRKLQAPQKARENMLKAKAAREAKMTFAERIAAKAAERSQAPYVATGISDDDDALLGSAEQRERQRKQKAALYRKDPVAAFKKEYGSIPITDAQRKQQQKQERARLEKQRAQHLARLEELEELKSRGMKTATELQRIQRAKKYREDPNAWRKEYAPQKKQAPLVLLPPPPPPSGQVQWGDFVSAPAPALRPPPPAPLPPGYKPAPKPAAPKQQEQLARKIAAILKAQKPAAPPAPTYPPGTHIPPPAPPPPKMKGGFWF